MSEYMNNYELSRQLREMAKQKSLTGSYFLRLARKIERACFDVHADLRNGREGVNKGYTLADLSVIENVVGEGEDEPPPSRFLW